jgi:protein involved in polysaccharide export with SLBB domain
LRLQKIAASNLQLHVFKNACFKEQVVRKQEETSMMEKLFIAMLWLFMVMTNTAHAADAPTTPATPDDPSYQLGSGDLIQIQVYGEADLSLEARITDSGTLSYPFLGQIQVAGRTLGQLQNFIVKGLKGEYLVDPKVSVTIIDYRQFYVNGEVKKPGGFAFKPGLTVRKAISLAGGMTERGSSSKISVISEKAPDQQKPVDMNTPVHPGDILTIEQSFF